MKPEMWSPEAEASVIGGMFLDPHAISRALETVRAEDFHREAHRMIFAAIVRVWERKEPVDSVTLVGELKDSGCYEAIGGAQYLARIMDAVPTAANIGYHAERVARFAALRSLDEAARRIRDEVQSAGDRTAEEIFGAAERIVEDAAPKLRGAPMVHLKDELWPAMVRLHNLGTPDEEPRIYTGIKAVDDMTGGFRRGDLVVIAARPSMGKSAMGVCNILGHNAITAKHACALFTIETNRGDVTDRLLSSYGRVDLHAARKRRGLADGDYPKLSHATAVLNTAPIYLDSETRTVDGMRAKLRKLNRDRAAQKLPPVALAVVDYLQMMEAPQFGINRLQEVSYISRELKKIAQEFGLVMVALAQLSRAVEKRPDQRPIMSDLRDSGTIEQDADVIAFIYRPERVFGPVMTVGKGKDAKQMNVEGKADIIIAKARDGEVGVAVVNFEKEYVRFADRPSSLGV